MSKQNGGIIGPDNVPTGVFGAASGVWKLSDVTNYKRQGTWPVVLTGHQVANSCRFNDGSSDYLNKNSISSGSRTTWTFSCWIKLSKISSGSINIFSTNNGSNFSTIYLANNKLTYYDYSGGNVNDLQTNAQFKDLSAFYNFVIRYDSTDGTSSNRIRFYVNGVQQTSFASSSYPSSSYNSFMNVSGYNQYVGSQNGTGDFYDGYMSEIVFVDGQQLAPTSFGETDSVTNNWIPKDVSGLTFGTNGFYLDFKDSSALGNDAAGSNNFTANNLTSIDQSVDTCTNNFATLNPLAKGSSVTLSNGNLTNTTSGSTATAVVSTIGVSQGKWFIETIPRDSSDDTSNIGVSTISDVSGLSYLGSNSTSWCYATNGHIYNNGSSILNTGTTHTINDIIGMAVDMDNGQVFFYKNGTIINSGNACITGLSGDVFLGSGAGNSIVDFNFGSPPYAISSGNTDSSGMGSFEYAVPSGYYSLCTRNLNLIG